MQILSPKTKKQFESYYYLRWFILRKPLGQDLGSEKDDIEEQSIHRMVYIGDCVAAVGRIHFNSRLEGQIRFMAVAEKFQKKGYGLMLLDDLEQKAIKYNIKKIILHARKSAIMFYEKKDYKIDCKSHLLLGQIQHYKMSKKLN